MKDVMTVFLMLLYNLILIVGSSYLIFYKGVTMWLYLIVVFFLAYYKRGNTKI
jgi:hypothetical protein